MSGKVLFYDLGILPVGKRCNLKCPGCFGGNNPSSKFFSSSDPLFEYLHLIGLRRCFIGGGEPFLHPKINEVIQKISEKLSIRYLLTNGMELNSNFKSLGSLVGTFVVSVDKMHEKGFLKKEKKNYLNEIFFRIDNLSFHNNIRVNTVAGSDDLPYLILMRKKISQIKNIKDWHIYPMTPKKLLNSKKRYCEIIDRINFRSPLNFKIDYKIPQQNFIQILVLPDYSIETLSFDKNWETKRLVIKNINNFTNLNDLIEHTCTLHKIDASFYKQTGD